MSLLDFRRSRAAPLLPRSDRRDHVLILVVAILTFLACLTVVAAVGADRAAKGWRDDLVGSATVLVRPSGGETADSAAERATEALAGVKGVAQASMLDREEAEALLRPWLSAEVVRDLPVPRLVALELDRQDPATAMELTRALRAAGVDASVDDHAVWMKEIVRAGQVARLAAGLIALLLAVAAAAVIAFATRTALQTYREAVELLHVTGAEDRFIARLFMLRFARVAAVAGAYGAAFAFLIAAGLRAVGGSQGLTPVMPILWNDLFWPLGAPIIAALVGALAARKASLDLLKTMP